MNSGETDNIEIAVSPFQKSLDFVRETAIYRLLVRHRLLHFIAISGSGVGIMLGVTWLLTHFIFGVNHYFRGYMIAVVVALVYAFTLHTLITFNTKARHFRRFATFVLYNLALAGIQVLSVRVLTPLIGARYYLLVISTVVAVMSAISYLFYKFYLFDDSKTGLVE